MYLSVDLGGTNTRVAISRNSHELLHVKRYGTIQDYHQGLEVLAETIVDLTSGDIPDKIAVGLAGVLDKFHGKIIKSPHLINYEHQPIQSDLEKILRTKVVIENDASLAGLAESQLGAGKNSDVVAYLTLSTGVGGSRIIQGQIDQSNHGFEPGHQIIDPNGDYWEYCGQTGCFESIASGTAFEKKFNIKPENCHNPAIWATFAKQIIPGIINIVALWSPDCLVIGGGLAQAGELLFQPLQHYLEEELTFLPCPELKPTSLKDDNVLLGGVLLISAE